MAKDLSPRLLAIVDALALRRGMRVLEIGCGPGAMAREIAGRIGDGHVLAIDRSVRAIAQARAASQAEIESGRLSLRQVAAEDFDWKRVRCRTISQSPCASVRWMDAIPRPGDGRNAVLRRR